jgi:hypothetical protein
MGSRYNAYAADLFESMGAEIAYADRLLKHRADGHAVQGNGEHHTNALSRVE